MQTHVLAVYTFNQFVAPYQSDAIKGFRDAEPGAFAAIEQADGFIARSGYEGEPGPASWGEQVFPTCWTNSNDDGWAPSTLSLWRDMESVMAATYHGAHGEAVRQGKKWHLELPEVPEYALWWVKSDHRPDWQEAVKRFELLMEKGPNPAAFLFKKAFDAEGKPIKPDTARIKRLANASMLA